MKFDIIGALDIAQKDLAPHECRINCSKSEEGYLVQIKVLVNSNQVYGQQIAFTNGMVLNNDWWYMNEEFSRAIANLKRQIEE